MSPENNGLDEATPNSKKNEKDPMMQLMDSFQSMVDEINAIEVNAIKEFANSITDAIFLSPMPDSPGTNSMLGNAQMPSAAADSASAESTETAVLESAEILAL